MAEDQDPQISLRQLHNALSELIGLPRSSKQSNQQLNNEWSRILTSIIGDRIADDENNLADFEQGKLFQLLRKVDPEFAQNFSRPRNEESEAASQGELEIAKQKEKEADERARAAEERAKEVNEQLHETAEKLQEAETVITNEQNMLEQKRQLKKRRQTKTARPKKPKRQRTSPKREDQKEIKAVPGIDSMGDLAIIWVSTKVTVGDLDEILRVCTITTPSAAAMPEEIVQLPSIPTISPLFEHMISEFLSDHAMTTRDLSPRKRFAVDDGSGEPPTEIQNASVDDQLAWVEKQLSDRRKTARDFALTESWYCSMIRAAASKSPRRGASDAKNLTNCCKVFVERLADKVHGEASIRRYKKMFILLHKMREEGMQHLIEYRPKATTAMLSEINKDRILPDDLTKWTPLEKKIGRHLRMYVESPGIDPAPRWKSFREQSLFSTAYQHLLPKHHCPVLSTQLYDYGWKGQAARNGTASWMAANDQTPFAIRGIPVASFLGILHGIIRFSGALMLRDAVAGPYGLWLEVNITLGLGGCRKSDLTEDCNINLCWDFAHDSMLTQAMPTARLMVIATRPIMRGQFLVRYKGH